MDRFWLLTSTTYGTWLPGDERGSVSRSFTDTGDRCYDNIPLTDPTKPARGLRKAAAMQQKAASLLLTKAQADVLAQQFKETAEYRGWRLATLAVMRNHIHLIVGVYGDPDSQSLLACFKSYGSRALNKSWGKPASERWWTRSGSTRKLPSEEAVLAAIRYVQEQEYPLVIWVDADWLARISR